MKQTIISTNITESMQNTQVMEAPNVEFSSLFKHRKLHLVVRVAMAGFAFEMVLLRQQFIEGAAARGASDFEDA